MAGVLLLIGVLVLAATTIDQFATIARGGSGSGFVVPRLHERVWQAALWLHRRHPSHRMLSAVGVTMLVATPILWALALWAGFTMVFSAAEGAVVDPTTQVPATGMGRAYFAGLSVFTLGTGDLVAGSEGWRMASALASLMGLAMITLGITYLVPVTQAASERRSLARQLRHDHEAAEAIGTASTEACEAVLESFAATRGLLAKVTEDHLSHHVLRYYHSLDETLSLPIRINALHRQIEEISAHHDLSTSARAQLTALRVGVADLAKALAGATGSSTADDIDLALKLDGRPLHHAR